MDNEPSSRQRVLKGGRIVFNSDRATIDCTVRSLGQDGALLRVVSVFGIPPAFTLVMNDGSRRACRVMQMTAKEIDVAFED